MHSHNKISYFPYRGYENRKKICKPPHATPMEGPRHPVRAVPCRRTEHHDCGSGHGLWPHGGLRSSLLDGAFTASV